MASLPQSLRAIDWTLVVTFALATSMGILIGVYFNVGWELDAATRAEQALFLAQRGAHWYFFVGFGQGYYVWLPFWQFLLAGIYLATGLNTTLAGIAVSATSLGIITLLTQATLKRLGLDRTRQLLGAALLFASGYLVAYSSQGMTDVFSTMLLFGTVYFLFVYLESHSSRSLVAASLLTLLNVMTRYEAWLFLAVTLSFALYLFASRKSSVGTLLAMVAYAIPSALFICVWLYYNKVVSGNYFGFASWISQNVSSTLPSFAHNPALTLANLAEVLLLSSGIFWLALLDLRRREHVPPVVKFASLLFVVYTASFLYSTYAGFSDGWVRFYLYFVPFSVVAFLTKDYGGKVFYLVLAVSIILGLVAFGQNVILHEAAVRTLSHTS